MNILFGFAHPAVAPGWQPLAGREGQRAYYGRAQ